MDMTTVYIWGTIGALFCLIMGAMFGYVRRENHHKAEVDALVAQNNEINVQIDQVWQGALDIARQQIHQLEIALLQASQAVEAESNAFNGMKSQWAYADKYRKAITGKLVSLNLWDFARHRDNPEEMLFVLGEHAAKLAVDPTKNKAAKNLHTRGVRKGAAMGRKQMAKIMQRTIDNQAETIQQAWVANSKKDNVISDQATEHDMYREAVRATLDDKIALPGVRKSIKQAICVELDRLKATKRLLED